MKLNLKLLEMKVNLSCEQKNLLFDKFDIDVQI